MATCSATLLIFFSCVFAVTIFFIYAQFIFHPDVVSGDIRAGEAVRRDDGRSNYYCFIFNVFLLLIPTLLFLQVRAKEFGLLSLFGMNNQQLRKLIYYEQTIISLLAIGSGLLIGTLFSKLFLMLMSALLQSEVPIAFTFVPSAYLFTIVLFFVLFQALTFLSFIKLKNLEVIELLKSTKHPKSLPKTASWLAILSLLFVAIGYFLAATASMEMAPLLVLPILFFVVTGSYFFFTQGTTVLYKGLYRNKVKLFSGTTLITRTNILFRLKTTPVCCFWHQR